MHQKGALDGSFGESRNGLKDCKYPAVIELAVRNDRPSKTPGRCVESDSYPQMSGIAAPQRT
jgi:hypothetical protein